MKRCSIFLLAAAVALGFTPTSVFAQRGRRGQRAPRPEVIRPADQRVPAQYSYDMVRPVAMADNVWMSELTILEMRDLVGTYGYTTALILNGTMESNGPYLTTGKHNHVLKVTGEAIARTLGNTLVAPIVMMDQGDPQGSTTPGRLVLSPATLEAVLRDMATSLKAQGFNEIIFLGDSGSNQRMLANVATLLGLLGTIVGLISAFNSLVNASAAEKQQKLAEGIGQAMYTTAFGVSVAIPLLFFHHVLARRSETILVEIESGATSLLVALAGQADQE